jgi:hypothetical protein
MTDRGTDRNTPEAILSRQQTRGYLEVISVVPRKTSQSSRKKSTGMIQDTRLKMCTRTRQSKPSVQTVPTRSFAGPGALLSGQLPAGEQLMSEELAVVSEG